MLQVWLRLGFPSVLPTGLPASFPGSSLLLLRGEGGLAEDLLSSWHLPRPRKSTLCGDVTGTNARGNVLSAMKIYGGGLGNSMTTIVFPRFPNLASKVDTRSTSPVAVAITVRVSTIRSQGKPWTALSYELRPCYIPLACIGDTCSIRFFQTPLRDSSTLPMW